MSDRGERGEEDPKRDRGADTETPAQRLDSELDNLGNIAKQALSTALAGGDITVHNAELEAATARLVAVQEEVCPVVNVVPNDEPRGQEE